MTEKDYAPLSSACVRGLCDKLYEKRKFAGVEIEKMVKDFNDANNSSQIKKLIRVLGQDLMSSTNPNVKNGALMGLSSVAVGLGKGCVAHLSELLHPMAACVREGESRVRYLAAEALFNVLKIARGAALPHFPLVFDALARLAADPEPQVRQGAELLDRLVKDIVTESGELEVSALVPLLRERLYARGACARQFAAGWVAALDALPALPLLPHLRDLLDPLLHMLDEPHPEIRRMCEVQLNEFLRSIKKDPSQVDFQAMINILITHAQSPEELVQLTAISWIKEFVELAGRGMLPYASGVLCAALPCLAYADDARRNIRETAATVNFLLTKLVADPGESEGEGEGEERLQLEALVRVLTQLLRHSSVHTKVAALDWILHLYNTLPAQMPSHTEAVFGAVVASLTDPADDVVRRALAVLAEICSCPARPARTGDLESSPYYYKFLRALLRLLAADDGLLEDRGAFIISVQAAVRAAERGGHIQGAGQHPGGGDQSAVRRHHGGRAEHHAAHRRRAAPPAPAAAPHGPAGLGGAAAMSVPVLVPQPRGAAGAVSAHPPLRALQRAHRHIRGPGHHGGLPHGGGQAGAAHRVSDIRLSAPGAAGRAAELCAARRTLRSPDAAAPERRLPRAATPPALRAAAALPRAHGERHQHQQRDRLGAAAGGVPARAGGASPVPPAGARSPRPRPRPRPHTALAHDERHK
ncbi:protein VAC14 homolog isoform X1 [Papilio machaon]|uniref:protein VAC14 homolog isoform X1 n=1 Tax=Papilio machaon TaxID=76193 RepID=UPI001E665C8D|nr:protein VAC14 homolog isoform X1 [Papilio machaon]